MLNLHCSIALFLLPFVQGYKYRLTPINDNILSPCPSFPDRDIHSFVDLSKSTIKKVNDSFVCGGNITYIWEDIEETAVLSARAVTEQFRYGKWGPTTYNVNIPNICRDMYTENTPWFDIVFKHIRKEDRLCINTKGLVWHLDDGVVNGYELILPGPDVTGIYRVLVHIFPSDKKDVIYCFGIEFQSLRTG